MNWTPMIVLSVFIALGLYDAVVSFKTGVSSSISRFLQRTSFKSPVFTLAVGMIIGHLFLYMHPEIQPECLAKFNELEMCMRDLTRESCLKQYDAFTTCEPIFNTPTN